ncbi:hypothetical protein EB796_009837 [Bugula neritina]|uniref:Uncharacterized protein n=1 Tax=Bugula neritina TaxID=10212 RepID=A0A7J7JZM6_BUGNE|nr:hypothetical protein EB796_009837 [Bugula neritina]
MYGTVKVFYEQNKYLLTDCLEAERKLKRVVIQDISVIPDAALLSNRRLCVTEDFSVITPCVLDDMILNPHIRQCVDLLQVSIDFLRESEEEIEQSLQSVNHSKNTAPAHSITMQESSNHSSHVFQNTQVFP